MNVDDVRVTAGRRLTWWLGLVLSLLVVLVYHLLFFNRFFPVQEGWFTAFAHEILAGKMPYRDFYLFLQPVYPLLVAAVVRVFGYGFIALRILGLLERLGLTAILFVLMARLFRPVTAFVATVASVAVFASNTSDVIDSYLQVCLVLSLAGVYLLVRSLEARSPGRAALFAAGAGALESVAFLTKQTTGLVVAAGALAVFAFVIWRERRRGMQGPLLAYTLGAVLPAAAVGAWLALNGAANDYLVQVYAEAASSKGPLLAVAPRALTRTLTTVGVLSFALIVAAGACWLVAAHWVDGAEDLTRRRDRLRVVLLGASAAALSIWWWVLDGRYRWPLAALIGVGILAQAAATLLGRRAPSRRERLHHWLLGPAALFVAAAVALAALRSSPLAPAQMWVRYQRLHFLDVKLLFVHWSLFACLGLAAFWLVSVWRRQEPQRARVFALCAVVAVAVMYAHGLSYVIEVHAAVPALGLALGALLEWRLAGRVARNAVVLALVVATLALCSTQRYMRPYAWWGWQEPSIAKAVVTPRTPLLQGFRLSPRSDATYANVTAIIRQAVLPGDWIYCFPNIPLFYVTSGVYPRTKALVAYWDVCPDDVARRDAATLLADPPAVIVDLRMDEPVWRFHEDAFRGGRLSGQRAIARAIDVLTSGDRYSLVMDMPTSSYSSLRVWVRADRRPLRLGMAPRASNHTGVASRGSSGLPDGR